MQEILAQKYPAAFNLAEEWFFFSEWCRNPHYWTFWNFTNPAIYRRVYRTHLNWGFSPKVRFKMSWV
jgi:hypothetical protein